MSNEDKAGNTIEQFIGSNNDSIEASLSIKAEVEIDSDADDFTSDDLSVFGPESVKNIVKFPSFVSNLLISDISSDVAESLALKLDLKSFGSVKNWETLAFLLGLSFDRIRYLRERAVHPHSPTIELLRHFRHTNLGHLLRFIGEDLGRIDVLIDVEPFILSLQNTHHMKAINSNVNTDDSGINSRNDDQPGPSNRRNWDVNYRHWMDKPLFKLDFNDGGRGVFDGLVEDREREILVTFYPDNTEHIRFVNWLCKNLRIHCAKVVKEDRLFDQSTNLIGSLTEAFRNATHIVVVLSTGYIDCIRSEISSQPEAMSVQIRKSRRLLSHLMDVEYLHRSCRNFRFRPVFFPSVDSRLVIPSGWISNTIVYHWPEQHDRLCRSIFGKATD